MNSSHCTLLTPVQSEVCCNSDKLGFRATPWEETAPFPFSGLPIDSVWMELTKICNQIYTLTLIKWENVKPRQFHKSRNVKIKISLVFNRVFFCCTNAFSLPRAMRTWAAPSTCWDFPLASQPYHCSKLWWGDQHGSACGGLPSAPWDVPASASLGNPVEFQPGHFTCGSRSAKFSTDPDPT